MPSAATNDAEARALLTVNATGVQGGVNWSASMTDNNAGFTGFQSSGANWTITMGGTVVTSASNRSYDYGTGNVSSPYFPRSESGFLALSPGTYTASGVYDTTVGVVGDASVSFSFTVFIICTHFLAGFSYFYEIFYSDFTRLLIIIYPYVVIFLKTKI
jgi:hypothetical protein